MSRILTLELPEDVFESVNQFWRHATMNIWQRR